MASTSGFACPLCSAPWRAGAVRCAACGADLTDPDVQAFVQQGPAQPAATEATGSLGAGRVLGFSREALADPRALRKLAVLGAFLSLVGFVLPALRRSHWEPPLHLGDDPRQVATHTFSWELWQDGNRLGLVFPLLAGLAGLVVALAPGLSARLRAGILAVFGLVGLLLGLGWLGSYALAPTQTATLASLGLIVAGVAIGVRVLEPTSRAARHGLVAGGLLFLLGMLVPVADLAPRLPGDYSLQARWLGVQLTDAVPLVQIAHGVDRRATMLLFVALWLLVPLVLIPAATALAWRQPQGIWDKGGLALRPLTFVLVLYVPITCALMAFSASGWADQLSQSAMTGRLRLFVLALPWALWAQLGLLALVLPSRPATS